MIVLAISSALRLFQVLMISDSWKILAFSNYSCHSDCDYESADRLKTSWEFHDSIFSIVLLDGLNNLRDQSLLCDVVFVSGSDEHRAHRAVLAAVSPFFRYLYYSIERLISFRIPLRLTIQGHVFNQFERELANNNSFP